MFNFLMQIWTFTFSAQEIKHNKMSKTQTQNHCVSEIFAYKLLIKNSYSNFINRYSITIHNIVISYTSTTLNL